MWEYGTEAAIIPQENRLTLSKSTDSRLDTRPDNG